MKKVVLIEDIKKVKASQKEAIENNELNALSAIKKIQEALKYIDRIPSGDDIIVIRAALVDAHERLFDLTPNFNEQSGE
jgi:hypothetical protein